MKFFKLFFIAVLFTTACNQSQTEEIIQTNPYPNEPTREEVIYDQAIGFAKENLDLQRVGVLLEESDNAEDFERLLNSEDGVNNLDLNGDGYVDYISVREFDEREQDERGFSLYSMFGQNEIQEIATIIFDRRGDQYPGARVLLNGNEQIYGDNSYYEKNWLDRSLNIVTWLFEDRNENYRSPYYYDNYPNYYEVYETVDTPVYRTRLEQYYPNPVFVYTAQPTITNIKINSPNNGRTINNIRVKMVKPTKQQDEFIKNNRQNPQFIKVKNEKREKNSNRREDNPNKFENFRRDKKEKKNNSDQFSRGNGKQNNPNKVERQEVKQNKVERQQNVGRGNQNKVERQNVKQDNPNKGGGQKNNGNGGGKGGGGKKGKN